MFRKFITRNIIALTIPILIIEFFVLIIVINLSVLDKYSGYDISYTDVAELENELDKLYAEGKVNVRFTCPGDMESAGYDYKLKNGKKGLCYYSYLGDSLRLYILSEKTVDMINKGENPTVSVRLEQNISDSKDIMKDFEEQLSLKAGTMDGYVKPIYANELNYPGLRLDILYYTKYAAILLMVISLLYMFIAVIFPSFNVCYKIVGSKQGYSRKELIQLVNKELDSSEVLDFENGYYQTEHFLVSVYVSYTKLKIIENEESVES